jgi:prephenate dehydrogenase
MGGSLAMALKRCDPAAHVVGCARRDVVRRRALEAGAVDEATADPCEAVRDADVTVFCVPVMTILQMAETCAPCFKPGSVVTDVGSTKAAIMARLGPLFLDGGSVFVGSHPIAGSEQTGLEAARADLYEGAMVVLTPPDDPPAARAGDVGRAVEVLETLWRDCGARTAVMGADAHDRIIARTSHLPHLVAAVLTAAVLRDEQAGRFCGSGFRDTTRVAAGSDAMWYDIVRTNREALDAELAHFASLLAGIRDRLRREEDEELRTFLEQTARRRRGWKDTRA